MSRRVVFLLPSSHQRSHLQMPLPPSWAWQAVVAAVVGRGRLLPRSTKLLTKLLQLQQPLPHCSGSSGPCLPTFQWLESDQCCHHCSASFGRGLFLAVPSPPFEVQPKFAPFGLSALLGMIHQSFLTFAGCRIWHPVPCPPNLQSQILSLL